MPRADVLLITGTTLLNDTLEDLLAWARPDARVTIVGPTVGLFPDAFLRRGADILGSVRIPRPDAFLDLLAEGGSGYHFFGRSVEKIVLVRGEAQWSPRPRNRRSLRPRRRARAGQAVLIQAAGYARSQPTVTAPSPRSSSAVAARRATSAASRSARRS